MPDPTEVNLQLKLLPFLPGRDQNFDQGWFFPIELLLAPPVAVLQAA
jgi:hypothetical protein